MTNEVELLNFKLVREILQQQGRTQRWVITQLNLGRSSGYALLRTGQLPEDAQVRARVLAKLAEITGLAVDDILLRPPGVADLKRTA